MQKKALLALMLALVMTLSGCALIQKDLEVDRAREIVRVGDIVYTKGEVQDQVNSQLNYTASLYSIYGLSFDPTDPTNISDAQDVVLDALTQQAVQLVKAKELGVDQFTEEQQAEIQANVDTTWSSYHDSVQTSYFADTELEGDELEAAINDQLERLGYKRDDVVETQTISYTVQKLREHTIADVTVSDEELQTALDERAETARTNYESNLSAYGSDVNAGTTVYYRPAGYRMVKQILIQFSDEDQAIIDGYQQQANTASSEASSQRNTLTSLGVTDIDTLVQQVTVTLDQETGDEAETTAEFTEEQSEEIQNAAKALAVAVARMNYFTAKADEATQTAMANIAPEADDVLAQLADGADWDALAAEHNDDPGMMEGALMAQTGYAVCENFSGFDSAFTAAAMAIPEVGQWSDKTEGMYGYYIIQYTSDVQEGPVALDEVRDTLHSELLASKQDTFYSEQLAAWTEELKPQTDKKALND